MFYCLYFYSRKIAKDCFFINIKCCLKINLNNKDLWEICHFQSLGSIRALEMPGPLSVTLPTSPMMYIISYITYFSLSFLFCKIKTMYNAVAQMFFILVTEHQVWKLGIFSSPLFSYNMVSEDDFSIPLSSLHALEFQESKCLHCLL